MLLRIIGKYLKRHGGALAALLILQTIGAFAGLWLPKINGQIIDNGVAVGDTHYIWTHGGLMLLVSLAQVAGLVGSTWTGGKIAMGLGRDLRSDLFDHVLSLGTRELKAFGTPTLITRNTNDIQQIQQMVFMSAVFMVSAPITMVGGVVMALQEDVGLAWLILAAVVALGIVIALIVTRMTRYFQLNQERLDTMNRVLREQISGIRVIRAFVREPHERKRFAAANHDLMEIGLKIGLIFSFMFPAVNLIMNVSSTGVMWFGALRADAGYIQVGQMTAFLNYLIQILISVMMASMMTMIVPRAAVSARRIVEVLDTPSSVTPPAHPIDHVISGPQLEFRDAEFSYPGAEAPVIADLNFTVSSGQTTAIIGATGSGKSTLVGLIPRLYDVTGGAILVDGVDVRELDPDVLWAHVGFVPQKAYLFTGTVASNLRQGKPDATDAELWEALRIAQADEFVARMDGQLDAPIAQGGTNVSGGQRQRLSIARAVIKRPDVYVFDDAFSALDVATDARLRAALKPQTTNSAVLIVAQRVTSIKDADQIIVLDEGRVCGIGTHSELMESCETYQEIVNSQLSAAEAA